MSMHASINDTKWHTPIKLLAMFATGGLGSLAMAPTNFWPAIFFGLSTLYIMVARASTPLKAGAFGFAFGLGYFGFSLSWIGNALLVEDNPYWWMWPLAVSGLPMVLSLFPAIAAITYKRLVSRYLKKENTILSYIAFCLIFAIADYARGTLFTGFPWNLYAHTWISVLPIAQLAALGDVYFLNILTIFWAVAPAYLLSSQAHIFRKTIYLAMIFATFIASYMYGFGRINSYLSTTENESTQTHVVIIQPNIEQSEKWKLENRAKNFNTLIDISHNGNIRDLDTRKTIIVWPETAISQDILDTDWTMEKIRSMLSNYPDGTILLTGALRFIEENDVKQYFNSIISIDKNGDTVDTYDKQHLVPFGEYIPLDSYIKISPVVGFAGFKRGGKSNLRSIHTQPVGAEGRDSYMLRYIGLICYEVIFPRYVHLATSKKPELIVNVTNDAWYGDSAGPYQHLVQARFRAIESGLPLVRSANTGISAMIGPVGNVVSSIDLMKSDILIEKLPRGID